MSEVRELYQSQILIIIKGKGDCDLSAVTGLFVGEEGKYDYGEHYKLKRGRRNPANGERLVNPGKLLKGRALLKHTNDGEFSGMCWASVLNWKFTLQTCNNSP